MILLKGYFLIGVLIILVCFLGGAWLGRGKGLDFRKLPAAVMTWTILLFAWPPFVLRRDLLKAVMADSFPSWDRV